MAEKEVLLTPEGLAELEKELETLKTSKRRQVAERIKQALEFGDISENAEYDDAKNEQAFIEGRIATVEKLLRNAKVLEDDGNDDGVAVVGRKVCLKDLETGDTFEYRIVGSAEANPSQAKISNESPVGQAILGKRAGTVVDVEVPDGDGVIQYELLSVSR